MNRHKVLSELIMSIEDSLKEVPELTHTWRFLTGVVYALNQYYLVADNCPRSKTEDEKVYKQETQEILAKVLEKQYPHDRWLRGFYYNTALMRLDACYERVFKAYLHDTLDKIEKPKCEKCKEKPPIDGQDLYNQIKKDFSSLFKKNYDKSNFGRIRHEVNSLKHFEGGADLTEREQPAILCSAVEDLIDFICDPIVLEKLKRNFPGEEPKAGRN